VVCEGALGTRMVLGTIFEMRAVDGQGHGIEGIAMRKQTACWTREWTLWRGGSAWAQILEVYGVSEQC